MKQNILGVIPARINSSRIPRKMLADVNGKTLIERTIERTKKARSLDDLIVTTDSKEVSEVAERLGLQVIMTDSDLPTGTDRVAAAVEMYDKFEPDIVVNVWGDEPLYPAEAIDAAVERLLKEDELVAAVVADRFTDEKMRGESSIVQVLTDLQDNALIFSRAPLPYPFTDSPIEYHHVIGALAMRRSFLKKLLTLERTPIEAREGVEQMRILEHGYKVGVIKGDFNNLGVNEPEELEIVRQRYKEIEGGSQ